jgi:hypothetical protein
VSDSYVGKVQGTPTLTTGQMSHLNLDTAGNLLVNIAQGSFSSSTGAAYNSAQQNFTNGTTNPLQADSHGQLLVNAGGTLAAPLRIDPVGTTAQPISGTVGISGTVPVSGTFWQATQPVSGAVTLQKRTQILTTSLLGASAAYTSPWQDTAATGTNFVTTTLYSSSVSIIWPGYAIQETDDTANTNLFRTVVMNGASAATLTQLTAQIKCRYWRVTVQNGSTPMSGSFEVTATESSAAQQVSLIDPGSNAVPTIGAVSADGQSPFNAGLYTASMGYVWNGSSWDRATPAGSSNRYNITSATLVKASAGRVVRVSVIVAGSTAGTVNDCATTGAAAASNQVATIPATVGVLSLDWPCATGLVLVPGTGQTLAVSYS